MPFSTTTPHPSTSGHSATGPGMADAATGNTRLAYIHEGTNITKVQETHYYPFGHRITPLSNQPVNLDTERNNAFLYNGKEFNDDFGLNWYDYGARFYDPQLARWHSVDPLAEDYISWSPYNYTMNNPIRFIDPDGMRVGSPEHGGVPAEKTESGYTSAQSSTYIPPQSQAVLEFKKDYEPQPPNLDETSKADVTASVSMYDVGLNDEGELSYQGIGTSSIDIGILSVSNESESTIVSEFQPVDLEGGGFNKDVKYEKNTLTMKTGLFLMVSKSEQTITRNGVTIDKGTATGISLTVPLPSYKGISFDIGIDYMGPYERK